MMNKINIQNMYYFLVALMIASMTSALAGQEENQNKNQTKINQNLVRVTAGQYFSIPLTWDMACDVSRNFTDIKLLVKGMDTGLHPVGCDPKTNILGFQLKKPVASREDFDVAWEAMLGQPFDTFNPDRLDQSFVREIAYTLILVNGNAPVQILSTGNLQIKILGKPFWGIVGAILMISMWGAMIWLGRYSGMLRDPGNAGEKLEDRIYSLSRVQMAWWFGIIMGSYIFLWVMKEDIPTLGSQALLMMGVSGATYLASAGMSIKNKPVLSSGNIFEDILADDQGVTLHRFQMLAMNIILGIMFIIHVVHNLTMPVFDGSLLTLMGISGGTYVGFKIPENRINQAGTPEAETPPAS